TQIANQGKNLSGPGLLSQRKAKFPGILFRIAVFDHFLLSSFSVSVSLFSSALPPSVPSDAARAKENRRREQAAAIPPYSSRQRYHYILGLWLLATAIFF